MPIVNKVSGNLLKMFVEDEFDIIVHGCNCFHTMGAGIAGNISRMFPEALEADMKTKYGDMRKLGTYSFAPTEFGMIVNGYTQFQPGREAKTRLYSSIGTVFAKLNNDAAGSLFPRNLEFKVGIPKIGAGIAGGDWSVIEGIIDGLSDRLSITLVDYDGK
jgi:O-acetyl-ADP-ribose deacetylase (regulator of RNase III)